MARYRREPIYYFRALFTIILTFFFSGIDMRSNSSVSPPFCFMSDLHLEFKFNTPSLYSKALEVISLYNGLLIIAGDLMPIGTKLPEFLDRLNLNKNLTVVYVPGNHEYYHISFEEGNDILKKLDKQYPNFHWLNNSTYYYAPEDIHIAGGTLWFPDSVDARTNTQCLNDFNYISQWTVDKAVEENKKTISFLNSLPSNLDIWVTHHAPSALSIRGTRYYNHYLNCYYVNQLEKLIELKKPKYYIHGHCHSNCDYELYSTRVLCNPLGYDWQTTEEIECSLFS